MEKLRNYSFVVPVFNRPTEIRELLESIASLEYAGEFEVVIVEDGSTIPCEEIVATFKSKLPISYYKKGNTGPGDSRNFGMQKAKGNYFIILDSDVILPSYYLEEVDAFLENEFFHCFGGPDGADAGFTNIQKAINYAMTSLLTTGGIRGNKKAVKKFEPRSFNMGLSRKAFMASGGFGQIHPGEDPDLSLRLEKMDYRTTLIPGAVVYHKRRIDWSKFYKQVYKFGLVRPILNKWHPGAAKITFWFPSVFITGLLFAVIFLLLGNPVLIYFYLLYFLIIGLDAAIKNKSFNIGLAAIFATFIQFYGYGTGYLRSFWKIHFLKTDAQTAFPELFFKKNAKT